MNLIIIFIIANLLNVVIQTVKSIATIKCGKWGASIINALAYGFYTYIVVLTVCDLSLIFKCLVVAGANLVGVFVVKLFEEKARKDKLWKVEVAVPTKYQQALSFDLKDIPHNYTQVGQWTMFNCYCETQQDTAKVVELARQYNGKISAYESKPL